MANVLSYTGMLWDYDMTWATIQNYMQNSSTILKIRSGSTNAEIGKEAKIQVWQIWRVAVFHQEKNPSSPLDDTMLTKLYSNNSL